MIIYCPDAVPAHQFSLDEQTWRITDSITRLRCRIEAYRWGGRGLVVEDEDGASVAKFWCTFESRPLSAMEVKRYGHLNFAEALAWKVGWSSSLDKKSEHSVISRKLITDFLCFNNYSSGRGNLVEGMRVPVLVSVEIVTD